MGFVIVTGIFMFGLFLIYISGKKIHQCKKYEFENRSNGGVVAFSSYEESEKFRRRKKGAEGQRSSGYVICMFAIFALVFVVQSYS